MAYTIKNMPSAEAFENIIGLERKKESKNPAIQKALAQYYECKQAYQSITNMHMEVILAPQQEPSYMMDALTAISSYLGGAKSQPPLNRVEQEQQIRRDKLEPARHALLAAMNNLETVLEVELKKEKEAKLKEEEIEAKAARLAKRGGRRFENVAGLLEGERNNQERVDTDKALRDRNDPTKGGTVREFEMEDAVAPHELLKGRPVKLRPLPANTSGSTAHSATHLTSGDSTTGVRSGTENQKKGWTKAVGGNVGGGVLSDSVDKVLKGAAVTSSAGTTSGSAAQQSAVAKSHAWDSGVTRAAPTSTASGQPATPAQKGFTKTGNKGV